MKCKDCSKAIRNMNFEINKELTDFFGTCGATGNVCKLDDNCKNGQFEKKKQ